MVLTLEEEKEINKLIYSAIIQNELAKSTFPSDKKEIKIEIGNFGCFLLGMIVSLILLGIWSWF